MSRWRAALGILDFFIPAEVLSAVLLVFTLENVLDLLFGLYVPAHFEAAGWVVVYLLGVTFLAVLNYVTASEQALDDLGDDLEDL